MLKDEWWMINKAVDALNTDTHRSLYTQRLLHYTQRRLHRGAFSHRRMYTQKLLHTDVFTHRSLHTQKPPHRKLLHTEAFTQTDKSLHGRPLWRCRIATLPQVLPFDGHFLRKSCVWDFKIAIYTPVFAIRPSLIVRKSSPYVCASDRHNLPRGTRFLTHRLTAPAAKREKSGRTV